MIIIITRLLTKKHKKKKQLTSSIRTMSKPSVRVQSQLSQKNALIFRDSDNY